MKHCIYKHTFPDGKVYVGQTFSGATDRRWRNGKVYIGGFREGLEIDERTQQILDEIMEQRWGWMQKKLNLGGTK